MQSEPTREEVLAELRRVENTFALYAWMYRSPETSNSSYEQRSALYRRAIQLIEERT